MPGPGVQVRGGGCDKEHQGRVPQQRGGAGCTGTVERGQLWRINLQTGYSSDGSYGQPQVAEGCV